MILPILILIIWLLVIPTAVGGIVAEAVDKRNRNLPFLWIMGQLLLWAVFQLIYVPFVLLQDGGPFGHMENSFSKASGLYEAAACILAVSGMVSIVRRRWTKKLPFRVLAGQKDKKRYLCYILWAAFWLLLIFQLVQAVRMTYADGDDAFYVAVSSITLDSDTMYTKLPYTGGTTVLDARHGLAPFPVWIAFLAKISGIKAVSTAHIAAPLVLIPMTYAVYYLIGCRLCSKSKEKLPLFLLFTELLVLFGDYSFYTPENFMIARSRQGKAALGNIILPAMIFLLFLILERMQENQKVGWRLWLLLAGVMTAGCLCSTLGAMLSCLLVGVTGLCAAVCYRRIKVLLPLALCCVPAAGYALLYLLLD